MRKSPSAGNAMLVIVLIMSLFTAAFYYSGEGVSEITGAQTGTNYNAIPTYELYTKAGSGDATALSTLKARADGGDAGAQAAYGYIYDIGKGVGIDDKIAASYYTKAAAQENAIAQTNLGVLYENGQGVAQDYGKAKEYYSKAAAQGNAIAQSNLGVLYVYGRGVVQDYVKAKEYYSKAAAQGNHYGQLNLADLYVHGLGVDRDVGTARLLYQRAAAQGSQTAAQSLKQLSNLDTAVLLNRQVTADGDPLYFNILDRKYYTQDGAEYTDERKVVPQTGVAPNTVAPGSTGTPYTITIGTGTAAKQANLVDGQIASDGRRLYRVGTNFYTQDGNEYVGETILRATPITINYLNHDFIINDRNNDNVIDETDVETTIKEGVGGFEEDEGGTPIFYNAEMARRALEAARNPPAPAGGTQPPGASPAQATVAYTSANQFTFNNYNSYYDNGNLVVVTPSRNRFTYEKVTTLADGTIIYKYASGTTDQGKNQITITSQEYYKNVEGILYRVNQQGQFVGKDNKVVSDANKVASDLVNGQEAKAAPLGTVTTGQPAEVPTETPGRPYVPQTLDSELSGLSSDLEKSQTELSQLQSHLDALKNEQADIRDRPELRDRLEAIESEIEDTEWRIQQKTAEKNSISNRIRELEALQPITLGSMRATGTILFVQRNPGETYTIKDFGGAGQDLIIKSENGDLLALKNDKWVPISEELSPEAIIELVNLIANNGYTGDVTKLKAEIAKQESIIRRDSIANFISRILHPSRGALEIEAWVEKAAGKDLKLYDWRKDNSGLGKFIQYSISGYETYACDNWINSPSEYFVQDYAGHFAASANPLGLVIYVNGKRSEYDAGAWDTRCAFKGETPKWFPGTDETGNAIRRGYLYKVSWYITHPFTKAQVDAMSRSEKSRNGLDPDNGTITYKIQLKGEGCQSEGLPASFFLPNTQAASRTSVRTLAPGSQPDTQTLVYYDSAYMSNICIIFDNWKYDNNNKQFPAGCIPIDGLGEIKKEELSVSPEFQYLPTGTQAVSGGQATGGYSPVSQPSGQGRAAQQQESCWPPSLC